MSSMKKALLFSLMGAAMAADNTYMGYPSRRARKHREYDPSRFNKHRPGDMSNPYSFLFGGYKGAMYLRIAGRRAKNKAGRITKRINRS